MEPSWAISDSGMRIEFPRVSPKPELTNPIRRTKSPFIRFWMLWVKRSIEREDMREWGRKRMCEGSRGIGKLQLRGVAILVSRRVTQHSTISR